MAEHYQMVRRYLGPQCVFVISQEDGWSIVGDLSGLR